MAMPGFLEVYGFYDNDAGAWAIDVCNPKHFLNAGRRTDIS
jgi:hypothetical protein